MFVIWDLLLTYLEAKQRILNFCKIELKKNCLGGEANASLGLGGVQ
jgi:hypothetical protein